MRLRSLLIAMILLLAAAAGAYWAAQPAGYSLLGLGGRLTPLREEIISAPTPLKGVFNQAAGQLTAGGVLAETNRHRSENSLSSLAGNTALDRAAVNKLEDMQRNQYFEHVSPAGVGPADLVSAVGYAYLRVGENLALGNFASDAALVQAWMDSPGHRANILSPGFTEIGLAVGPGIFEGERTWFAVQTFALPASACANIDPALRTSLEQAGAGIDEALAALEQQKESLNQKTLELNRSYEEIKRLSAQGNEKIKQGNEQIKKGNDVYEETGDKNQAQPYWDEGERLQAEGKQLIEQAESLQADAEDTRSEIDREREQYNLAVDAVNERIRQNKQLAGRLNQQIRAYNECLESLTK